MKRYIILISNRSDSYDRYWVSRPTLKEAEKVASEYEKDNKYLVEIVETAQCVKNYFSTSFLNFQS